MGDNKELIILLAYTESSLDYNVKHPIKDVVGICGINKFFWKDELKENNIQINSLSACEYVLNYYLDKYNGNKRKALAAYKGFKKDKKVNKVVDKILQVNKKLDK